MKSEYLEDCPYYLNDFLTYMKVVKDRGERTVEAYYIDIRTFLRYLNIKHKKAVNEDFSEITIEDTPLEWVENFSLNDAYVYLGYLSQQRNNSVTTRARKCSALKQFYSYLHKKAALIKNDPMVDLELPRIKQSLPKYLTTDQSIQLLKNVDSKHKQRDFCMLVLFLTCGMRLSELVGLDMNDYSKENRTLRLFGKGRKERIVYLNDVCIDALEDYINNYRPKVDEKAIFLSANKTRINKRRVQQIVEEQLKLAGLSNLGITTHKLRHSAATMMYKSGVDTLVLKEVLGHKSIATTEIYTHISNSELQKAAEASPIAGLKNNEKK
jgi:site-specific recombinase XerD